MRGAGVVMETGCTKILARTRILLVAAHLPPLLAPLLLLLLLLAAVVVGVGAVEVEVAAAAVLLLVVAVLVVVVAWSGSAPPAR